MKFNFDISNRKSYSYLEYRSLINELLAQGKTTGTNHSDSYIEYTKMNVVRMRRWDKIAVLNEDLIGELQNAIPQTWILLTEAWCGDAAQNIPWIVKMAETSPHISLHLILRDENLDIMDEYLTNGGRSIPKLIAISNEGNELFNWGSRPEFIQNEYLKLKSMGHEYSSISEIIHKMYAKNKGKELQNEFLQLLKHSKLSIEV
ncbi:MAG: hypothetical protein RLZZ337_678 [Bacteroidota bacterium]|jgi:hypothetical protein